MIAYSRPKRSDLYTLCWSKLLENHNLHSGTYLYGPYMAVPPPPGCWAANFGCLSCSTPLVTRKYFISSSSISLEILVPFAARGILVFTVWKIYIIVTKHFCFDFIEKKKHTKRFFQAGSKSPSFFSWTTSSPFSKWRL